MHLIESHEKQSPLLYLIYEQQVYAIPKKIIKKYAVKQKPVEQNILPNKVFAKLDKKLGKAGSLLKGLRIREGLTQTAFANKIGLSQANLSAMENGHRAIGKAVAKRVEKAFGVDYRYFL